MSTYPARHHSASNWVYIKYSNKLPKNTPSSTSQWMELAAAVAGWGGGFPELLMMPLKSNSGMSWWYQSGDDLLSSSTSICLNSPMSLLFWGFISWRRFDGYLRWRPGVRCCWLPSAWFQQQLSAGWAKFDFSSGSLYHTYIAGEECHALPQYDPPWGEKTNHQIGVFFGGRFRSGEFLRKRPSTPEKAARWERARCVPNLIVLLFDRWHKMR